MSLSLVVESVSGTLCRWLQTQLQGVSLLLVVLVNSVSHRLCHCRWLQTQSQVVPLSLVVLVDLVSHRLCHCHWL